MSAILGMLIAGCGKKETAQTRSLKHSAAADQFKQFATEKEAQAQAAAKAEGKEMLPECKALFEAAAKGNWKLVKKTFDDLAKRAPQYSQSGKSDARLVGSQWQALIETEGAMEAFAMGGDKYPAAFGRDIIDSIPAGSIYFGGTDPGRFVVTAMCRSHVNADPFFTVTQNALADGSYLAYLRDMYGEKIYIPTDEDSQSCFNQYLEDAKLRKQRNQLKPGEDVTIGADGKPQVRGQVAVMQINALLAKLIFDKNPNHEFYVEESFPLDWMYPHLEPNGLIFKINRNALSKLSGPTVQQDREYWTRYVQPMVGDWLDYDTPLSAVADYVEKVSVKPNFSGFKGDRDFVQNDYAQRSFSKLRSSIGGLYDWRADHAANAADKEAMAREADFAFRQAWAMCPYSPEAVFRYVNLLTKQKRTSDALLVAETTSHIPGLESGKTQIQQLVTQLKRMSGAR